jgi:hypothetical protein
VEQLGANAHGEVLEPGRVPDCYLGLRLEPADVEAAAVLMVAPAALLHPVVPQPDGTVLYELLTGHPDRTARELVFLADLTVELRAWPTDTWPKVEVDPQAAAGAVVAGWQRGDLAGLQLGGLTAEEALALERPAMTYVRGQLGSQLAGRIGGGGTGPADVGPATASHSSRHPQTAAVSAADTSHPDDIARRPRQGSAAAADNVGGAWRPLPCRRSVDGRSAAGGRHVPALLRGLRRCPRVDGGHPAQHPGRAPRRTADTAVAGSADGAAVQL